MRETLESGKIHTEALKKMGTFHSQILTEVKATVAKDHVVVVGMKQNPFVGKARKLLTEKNIPFTYLEYGSYWSQWKPRLSIKLWSGWPTFPQIFIGGTLIGGYTELKSYLETNAVKK